MFTSYRNIMAGKAAGEMDETGFTLIELLIVIVVLGILAGVVIFALGGVTGQSAVAACKADGATVSTALAAFNTDNPNLAGTAITTDDLGPTPTTGVTVSGGPFLQSWPSNGTHYAFSLGTATPNLGALMISVPSTATPVAYTGSNMTAGTGGCNDVK